MNIPEQHHADQKKVEQESAISSKDISTTGLAKFMWRMFKGFLWSIEEGSLILHLGFQSLLDITKFWVAYREGKLAKELQQYLSSSSSKGDGGFELTVDPVIDPMEYAKAVTCLAEVEGVTDTWIPTGV